MKLKFPFETVELDDEIVAVPVGEDTGGFHGVLRLNDSAAEILGLLAEETDVETVARSLAAQYESPEPAVLEDYVRKIASTLEAEGLLEI